MNAIALDIQAISRISAVPSILELMLTLTGMRFATVARVTNQTWMACAVNDQMGFGLQPGAELPLHTTICHEVRQRGQLIAFGHASEDPVFRMHAAPKRYGFESYISLPIVRADGSFFGTLCSLDPQPKSLEDPALLRTLTLFAQLIAANLDADAAFEQKSSELQSAREEALLRDQFVAVLGHDLRNPLNSILISAEVLEAGLAEPRTRSIVSVIRRSCGRMTKLIDDVLDFARGKLGTGIPVSLENTDQLPGLVRQVASEIQVAHPTRPLEVSISLPGLVRCDAPRLAQLLDNLLSNAMTHGEPGTPVAMNAAIDGDVMTVAVVNQGTPIPPHLLQQIFEPFVRLEPRRNQGGLGLGLYIASEIAKGHGGTLAVTSSVETGTCFTFAMPCPKP